MRHGWDMTSIRTLIIVLLICVAPVGASLGAGDGIDGGSILELSLEDLLDIEVTSVSKRPQSLHDAAAAIFVITNEDMVRMGATSIADALRHVPGLHVARIDANKWAITSRGFNGRFSNKLLVLIDGRSVYTTSFSGVYWEERDTMLEDVDRIEVIRGPGSTLWGANAVNGVINIITKHAADTQGGVAVAGAGDVEQGFGSVRWGTSLADGTYARIYGKTSNHSEYSRSDSQDAGDEWNMSRGGFRLDSQRSTSEALMLQGDLYNGTIHQQTQMSMLIPPYAIGFDEEVEVSGGSVLGRWERTISSRSSFSFQVYFDRTVRKEALTNQTANQFDYDFQHHFATGRHTLVWGLGYRHTISDLTPTTVVTSDGKRDYTLYSLFVQDEFSLRGDRLVMIFGSKFEHNDYTGVELQPSARLMWRAHDQHRVWAAVSRAVRTPSRAEDDLEVLMAVVPPNTPNNPAPLPVGIIATGDKDFDAEDLLAYEVGYRFTNARFSADVAAFYNEYSDLRNSEFHTPEVRFLEDPAYIAQPLTFTNSQAAVNYGFELAAAWQMRRWLHWQLAYSLLKNDPSADLAPRFSAEKDPAHRVSLTLGVQPTAKMNLGLGARYVDDAVTVSATLPSGQPIPSYTALDAVISWRLSPDVELSFVGRDLLEKSHLEFAPEAFTRPSEVPRSFYAKIRWDF